MAAYVLLSTHKFFKHKKSRILDWKLESEVLDQSGRDFMYKCSSFCSSKKFR